MPGCSGCAEVTWPPTWKTCPSFVKSLLNCLCMAELVRVHGCRGVQRSGGWQRKWVPSPPQSLACLAWATSCSHAMAAFHATGNHSFPRSSCTVECIPWSALTVGLRPSMSAAPSTVCSHGAACSLRRSRLSTHHPPGARGAGCIN